MAWAFARRIWDRLLLTIRMLADLTLSSCPAGVLVCLLACHLGVILMFYRVQCLLSSNLSLVNSATVLLSLQLDNFFLSSQTIRLDSAG